MHFLLHIRHSILQKNFVFDVSDRWYKFMWRFTPKDECKIEIKEGYLDLPLLQKGDVKVISVFSQKYKTKALKNSILY